MVQDFLITVQHFQSYGLGFSEFRLDFLDSRVQKIKIKGASGLGFSNLRSRIFRITVQDFQTYGLGIQKIIFKGASLPFRTRCCVSTSSLVGVASVQVLWLGISFLSRISALVRQTVETAEQRDTRQKTRQRLTRNYRLKRLKNTHKLGINKGPWIRTDQTL